MNENRASSGSGQGTIVALILQVVSAVLSVVLLVSVLVVYMVRKTFGVPIVQIVKVVLSLSVPILNKV